MGKPRTIELLKDGEIIKLRKWQGDVCWTCTQRHECHAHIAYKCEKLKKGVKNGL